MSVYRESDNWRKYLDIDADAHIYVLKCAFFDSIPSYNEGSRTYVMKSSHGYNEIGNIRREHIDPRKWFRIHVLINSRRSFPLIVYLASLTDHLYYVGATQFLKRRVKSHINGNAGRFTDIMDVVGITRVESITADKRLHYLMSEREEFLGSQFTHISDESEFKLSKIKRLAHYDRDQGLCKNATNVSPYSLSSYDISVAAPSNKKRALQYILDL